MNAKQNPKPAPTQMTDFRALVDTAWDCFRTLAKSSGRPDLTANLEPAVNRFELGLFRLVVMGEIKKGKSGFINALLAEPALLPTASDVATSVVFKVMYGPERKFKVFFLPDIDTNRRPEPKEIQAADIRDYGTEDGNKGNAKRVDFIGIELPHPLLNEGLAIIDTPGIGGLFRAHRDITWRYAPSADAICFVLDSVECIVSNDEVSFLKELTQKVTKKIFFVQTKTDATDAEQWRGWEKRNREHLSKHLCLKPEQLLYFPVSSKDKTNADAHAVKTEEAFEDLKASGFVPVLKFLNQGLMKQKERILAQQVSRQILAACAELDRQGNEQLRIAQAKSKEDFDTITAELGHAEKELTAWERETYPHEMRRFEDEFSRLRLHFGGRFRGELDSKVSITGLINQIQVSRPDPKVLNEQAGTLQQDMLARASETVLRIEQEFSQQAIQQIQGAANRLFKGFKIETPGAASQQPFSLPASITDTLHMEFKVFDQVQRGMMGAGLGYGLATLVSVIIPVAAPIALLAAAIGGAKGYEQYQDQKRDQAIGKLQQLLTETMIRVSSQAQQHFSEMSQQLERFARDAFEEAVKRARADLQNRLQDVQAARLRSRQDTEARVKELKSRITQSADLAQSLAPLTK
jgi:hypothetical protein